MVALLAAAVAIACSAEKPSPSPEPSVKKKAGAAAAAKQNASQAARPVARRLLLLGIDGATWDLIDPLLAQDKLPNLARLIGRGTRAHLQTFEPTASPLIWTSIATGVPPEVHGITDFVFEAPGTKERLLPTSNLRRVSALWDILSGRGHTVGLVGWWATYPAERVDGFVVSDQAISMRTESYRKALEMGAGGATESARETHPPGLDALIEARIEGSDAVGVDHLRRFMKIDDAEIDALKAETSINVESVESIFKFALLIDQAFIESFAVGFERHSPDFATLYLNGLDAAEHHFWKYIEPEKFQDVPKEEIARYAKVIENYHVYMDEVLGRVLALYGDEQPTVLVLSDHGHHANPKYDPTSADHFSRVCSGDHSDAPPGILVMAGPDIRAGAELNAPSVYDIAPTVLALMGAPLGKRMKGRVLSEAIDASFLEAHPVTKGADYTRTFDDTPLRAPMGEALKDKLKGLGYIQ
jgi:predicted AlkP superfamily phosphohydrolase/phosphomutase